MKKNISCMSTTNFAVSALLIAILSFILWYIVAEYQIAQQIEQEVVEVANDVEQAANEAAEELAQEAEQEIEEVAEDIEEWVENAAGSIAEWANELRDDVVDFANDTEQALDQYDAVNEWDTDGDNV